MDKLPKKRQKVMIATPQGGRERYLDELVPREKISLNKKIKIIIGIVLIFLFFLLLIYLQHKYS